MANKQKMTNEQVQDAIKKMTQDFKRIVENHENEINTLKKDVLEKLGPKFEQEKKGTPARKMVGQQIKRRLDYIKMLEKLNAQLKAYMDNLQDIKKAQDLSKKAQELSELQKQMNNLLKEINPSSPEASKQASVVVPLGEKALKKDTAKAKETEENKHPLVEAYNNSDYAKQYGPAVPHTLPNGIQGMKLQFPNQEAAEKFFTEQAEKGHQFTVCDLGGNITHRASGGKLEKVSAPTMRSQVDSVGNKPQQPDLKQYDKGAQAKTTPEQTPTSGPEKPKLGG